jgi:hypothetical protein
LRSNALRKPGLANAILLRQAVHQLELRHRQAVDEERNVERALRLVAAVGLLACDAEAVRAVPLCSLRIAR